MLPHAVDRRCRPNAVVALPVQGNGRTGPGMTDFAKRRRTMVDTQVRPSDVTKFPIIDAMLKVPREMFVPDVLREAAYIGENLPLGKRRVILEPRTLAKMLDALNVEPGHLVLDIGTGLGYSTAVLAHLAQAVVAVEQDEAFAAEAEAALSQTGIDNAAVYSGALAAGAPKHGPYDIVILQGAIETLPATIADQLATGGRIAALFMTGALGECRIGIKSDSRIGWRYAFNASAPVLPGFELSEEFTL